MEFLELIMSRRSIRHFKKNPVEREKIELLLRSAMFAPTAANRQPWYFIVIDDRQLMSSIMKLHPNSWMLETASHAIAVCGDENLQHGPGYWTTDCGAATENILLAAKALDLGSCWIGVYPKEKRMESISGLLKLPGHIRVFSLIAIGYPDEVKERPDRYKPERIYSNTWSNPY